MIAGHIGFVGLGTMGSALSGHLIRAGYAVAGYDIDPARMEEHAARGGTTVAGPAWIDADVVVSSLPSTEALWDMLRGDSGLAARPGAGRTVIETSTLAIEEKEVARDFLADHGIALLDCPLSGTGAQAQRGDVVAYVSGDDEAKAAAAPVLNAMTRGWYDVGEFGNGMRMKIIANLLVTVHNLAAAEALVLAERAGLDLETVLTAVGDGAGTSRMFEVRGPLMVAGNYAEPGMRTRVFAKDIAIIDGFARRAGAPTPLFSAASAYYRAALAQGRDDDDTSCVHAVLRQFASDEDPRC